MKLYDFLFSDKPSEKITRHVMLWTIYGSAYFIQSMGGGSLREIFSADTLLHAAKSTFCFLPLCFFCTYTMMYVLSPNLLEKKKYIVFLFSLIALYFTGIWFNFYITKY